MELQRRTPKRMHKVLRRSIGFALFLYVLAGVFGYFTFLQGTCSNIILNKYKKHIEVIIAAIAISGSMLLTIPLFVFAFREELTLLWKNQTSLPWMSHTIVTFVTLALGCLVGVSVSDISVGLFTMCCENVI